MRVYQRNRRADIGILDGLPAGYYQELLSCCASAARCRKIYYFGLAKEKVVVTGNLKFDVEIPKDLLEQSQSLRREWCGNAERFVWIAASTHPQEEEIMLTAQQILKTKVPDALLILVPRHPERFDAVAQLIQRAGLNYVRFTEAAQGAAKAAVVLADVMGKMLLLYAVADAACVAGSFAQVGGHNVLEPAVLRKPVMTGPVLFFLRK